MYLDAVQAADERRLELRPEVCFVTGDLRRGLAEPFVHGEVIRGDHGVGQDQPVERGQDGPGAALRLSVAAGGLEGGAGVEQAGGGGVASQLASLLYRGFTQAEYPGGVRPVAVGASCAQAMERPRPSAIRQQKIGRAHV